MRRYNLFCVALAMFVLVSLLGGCSSSNKEGQPASTSIVSGGVSADANIQAEITGVTISSPPVITFKLLDENGLPLDPATITGTVGSIRFMIAQLKADGNYANYIGQTKTPGGATSGDPSYETTANGGVLAAVGNGIHTYTFNRDITKTAQTLGGLVYDAAQTHTAAILISKNTTGVFGKPFTQIKNVYFTFRPDGQPVTRTREIVATSNCNECHGKLGQKDGSFHGGNRREVAVCILCHNPALAVNSVPFDFKFLIHRIHMGKNLPGNVAAIAAGGAGFATGSSSFADIGFPFMSGDGQVTARPIECVKCHKAGMDANGKTFGKDAERWRFGVDAAGKIDKTKTAATKENCTTCHDTISFDAVAAAKVADATATVSGTTTTYTPKLTTLTAANGAVVHTGLIGVGGTAWTDSQCGGCHPGTVTGDNAYQMSVTGHHAVFEQSSIFTGLNYQILSVVNAKPGSKPTVNFRITDDKGNSISPLATTHVAGTSGTALNDVSFSLKMGYFRQADYVNEGMNNYGQPFSQATNGLATTITPAGTTAVGTPITVPASATTPTKNADGSYTITFFQALPATATGTGVIGLEGTRYYTIPATQKKAARAVRAGGKSVQYYFDLTTGSQITDLAKQRRKSVDAETKCNSCHSRLLLHGGNRTNEVQECVICHNPNATDRSDSSTTAGNRSVTKDAAGNITAYNSGADGKFSQSVHFKVMIHRIHTGERLDLTKNNANGTVSYFINSPANDFSDITYPRDRRDCLACHIEGDPILYGLPLPDGVLGTKTLTGATISGTTPTFTATIQPPGTATCLSCHDTGFELNHTASHVTGSGAAAQEFCVACHQTGLLQAVDTAHKPLK